MFNEIWIDDEQLDRLVQACRSVRELPGAILEFGCWEGRSTVALANACAPEVVVAVDSWLGNLSEGRRHETVQILRKRDVHAAFLANVRELTGGNVAPHRADCFAFLTGWRAPVKFCHVDAAHDHDSVARLLRALVPLVVPGGVLCGDDYASAHAGRADLDGGVERACREVLPGHQSHGNFWIWRRPA